MKKEYRNSLRTKRMIREAFAQLIGEKKMISNISVAELSERADIAKSTFYNHYEDIYSVADEIWQEILDGLNLMIDMMEADKTNDHRIYIKNIFNFLRQNEGLYRNLVDSPDAVFFIGKIKHLISERVFAKITSVALSKKREERYVQISFLADGCVDIMVAYLRGEIEMSFDELEDTMMSLLEKFM